MLKPVLRNVRKIIAMILVIALCVSILPVIDECNAYGQTKEITSFENLEKEFVFFEGSPALDELLKEFPKTIGVHFNGEKSVSQIPVTWEAMGGYDQYNYYSFVFYPKWEEAYTSYEGIEAPTITAFRKEAGVEIPVDEEDALDVFCEMAGLYSYGATNEELIYNYLTETMKLNMAAACGVLANMYAESGLKANNLENTYNESLGMTDAEYTKKVNDKSYTRKQFVDDDAGYGLCQWTFGRKGKLYDFAVTYCKEKNISFNIANRNMQLEFFKKEVSESYMPTWNTLSTAPNIEMGAFLSAFVMCHNFEVPADTGKRALSRGKSCLTAFWDNYSSKASNYEKNIYFGICGVRYPTKITSGMACNGYIVSNKGIAKVEAYIINKGTGKNTLSFVDTIDTENNTVICYDFIKTENEDGKTIDDFAFGDLADGSYTYKVVATDVTGKTLTFSKDFTVSDDYSSNTTKFASVYLDPSTLKLTEYTSPATITKGDGFAGTGTVTSNYDISYVSVGIKNSDGTIIQKKTANLDAKSYYIDSIAAELDFPSLSGGEYTYYVYAKDQLKAAYVLKQSFAIDSKGVKDNNEPNSLATGKDFNIKGIVSSDIKLTKVYARVVNSDGKVITYKSVTPNALTYDLSKLNESLDFSKCVKGNYRYVVSATDQVGTTRLIDKSFSVYTASTLRAINYTYPKTLKYKSGFAIKGTVKSNYYLKTVTIKVVNSQGNVVIQASSDLTGKKKFSYGLSNLDSKVKFGSLKRGTYRYKVIAVDSKVTRTLINKVFYVK